MWQSLVAIIRVTSEIRRRKGKEDLSDISKTEWAARARQLTG